MNSRLRDTFREMLLSTVGKAVIKLNRICVIIVCVLRCLGVMLACASRASVGIQKITGVILLITCTGELLTE